MVQLVIGTWSGSVCREEHVAFVGGVHPTAKVSVVAKALLNIIAIGGLLEFAFAIDWEKQRKQNKCQKIIIARVVSSAFEIPALAHPSTLAIHSLVRQ